MIDVNLGGDVYRRIAGEILCADAFASEITGGAQRQAREVAEDWQRARGAL